MKYKSRKPVPPSRLPMVLACFIALAIPDAVSGQEAPARPTPEASILPATGIGHAPPGPGANGSPTPSEIAVTVTPPPGGAISYSADALDTLDKATGAFAAHGNVMVSYGPTTVTADKVEGNFEQELIFSGHAKIEAAGAASYADAIHVYVRNNSYGLDNPRATLQPSFLRYQVTEPVYVYGGQLYGNRSGHSIGNNVIITTCVQPKKDYELRARSAELIPHKKLILRHVGIVFFGQKLVTLPILVIPLDERLRRFRTNYLPEFGQNINEGYFARFPYEFAVGATAAALVRLDFTQKLGEGYRVESEYLAGKQSSYYNTTGTGAYSNPGSSFGSFGQNGDYLTATGYGNVSGQLPRLGNGIGPQNGGLIALQGYFNQGFNNDFNASFRHQQNIGSNNRISIDTELQNNSFYTYSNQSSQTTKFDFAHNDTVHGVTGDAAFNYLSTSSPNANTNQFTGNLTQSFTFDTAGSNRNILNYGLNLSQYNSTTTTTNYNSDTKQYYNTTSINRTEDLDTTFQFQHFSREYNWELQTNKNITLQDEGMNSSYGSLERLPELQLTADTINFKGGLLHSLPAQLTIGVGQYSEPSTNVTDDRVLMGLTVQEFTLFTGHTEMVSTGGFEQRLYGDSAAQYIVRNTTRLRQHLGGRSGFDLTYDYEQPEGGTPFLFDTLTQAHYVTAEGGYLDDKHFQAALRVGYDLTGTSSSAPWQSLSGRLMWHPTPSVRFDSLFTYDPNSSRFYSASGEMRVHARNNFALDILTQYDPTSGKFSAINGQLDAPLGRTWRIAALARYNGYTGDFESTNFQLTHRWDCLEASATYTDAPYGFRPVREFYVSLRITAFPFFRSFARGPAGESLGPGIGQLY